MVRVKWGVAFVHWTDSRRRTVAATVSTNSNPWSDREMRCKKHSNIGAAASENARKNRIVDADVYNVNPVTCTKLLNTISF